MSDYYERISDEWRERAPELAEWAMQYLVNRTDVWGRYLGERYRKANPYGNMNKAITAPFKQERGKIFLQQSSLEKHFKAKEGGGVLGLHQGALFPGGFPGLESRRSHSRVTSASYIGSDNSRIVGADDMLIRTKVSIGVALALVTATAGATSGCACRLAASPATIRLAADAPDHDPALSRSAFPCC